MSPRIKTVDAILEFVRKGGVLSVRTFRGEEAAALGVASEALPAEEVLPRAREWALDVAVNAAPASVAIAKRLLWEGVTETPAETMAKEGPLLSWIGKQPDAAEGVRSFLERRSPEWKLRASTDELIARGGFGSPTIFVNGDDMYFGNDRLVLVREALRASG